MRRTTRSTLAALALLAALHPAMATADPAPQPPRGDELVGVGAGSNGALQAPPLPPGTTWIGGAVTENLSYGLRSDGRIIRFGADGPGLEPPALPAGTTYVDVAVVGAIVLAVRSDGQVVPFADGYPHGLSTPPALPDGVGYVDVALPKSAGDASAIALRTDGHVVGWGNGGIPVVPPLPVGTHYTSIDLGYEHAAAVRSDGVVVTWGNNGSGQRDLPPPPPGETFVDVATGLRHTVALASDGTVVSAGLDLEGQLTPLDVPPGRRVVDLEAGRLSTLALLDDGTVRGSGVVGAPIGSATFPAPPDGTRYTRIVAGGHGHALLLRRSVSSSLVTLRGPRRVTYGSGAPTWTAMVAPGTDAAGGQVGLRRGPSTTVLDHAVVGPSGQTGLSVAPTLLRPGRHELRASFSGTDWARPGTSAPLTVTVVRALPSLRLAVPRTVRPGASPVVRLRLVGPDPTPTGRIVVRDAGRVLARVRLRATDAGRTVLRLPRLAPGRHRVTAAYAGSPLLRPATTARTVRAVR